MATVTLKGNPVTISGELPAVGSKAPAFNLTKGDLGEAKLSDYAGKNIVLSIVPSLDTGTCATSARKFNEQAGSMANTVVLCVSADLPFAQNRFCTTENIKNVVALSSFRNPEFGKAYGVTIQSAPLAGLLTRAIVVIGADGTVKHTELVGEIVNEPNYQAAISAIKK